MKRRGILGVFLVSSAIAISAITFSSKQNKTTELSAINENGSIEAEVFESEFNPIFYPASYSTSITNEPKYQEQKTTTFDLMNFSETPSQYRGDSVKVAVIDSGINYAHEDFGEINDSSRTIEYSSSAGKCFYYQIDVSDANKKKINDTSGHGTKVASVIASQINSLGCAGIAPNVDLYIYKVTNSGNGYEWTAINDALQYCIDNKMDVINMSFQAYENAVNYNGSTMGASTGCSSVLSTKINACYNAGITLVGAAGNYNTSEPSYPASNNHVISVGSLADGSTTEKAGFSNKYGIDLVAPGYVHVANIGGASEYKKTSGTSFSAPIVTAAIALYKQKNPTATPAQIEKALYATCDPVSGNPGWAGHGRLNIDNFVNYIAPQSVSVGETETTLLVGDTYQINASVLPSGANQSVLYESSDTDVCTVTSSGLVEAVGVGEASVKVKSVEDPTISKMVYFTVEKTEEAAVYKTITFTSSTMSNGTAGYSNVSFINTCDDITTRVENGNNNKKQWNSVKFGSKSQDCVGTLTNTSVIDKKISKIDLTFEACSNVTSAKLYVSTNSDFSNATEISFSPSGKSCSIPISNPIENGYYKIVFNISTATSNGPVNLKQIDFYTGGGSTPTTVSLSKIEVTSSSHRTFTVGATFAKETITATYSNSSTKNVTNSATFSGYNMSETGTQTVNVSYTESDVTKTTSYTITVNSSGGGSSSDPGDYYKNVDLSTQKTFTDTLHNTISANTVDVGYNGLWNAYEKTDMRPGTNYYWDMYSNYNYNGSSPHTGSSGEGNFVNREHTVPQSWFNESSPMKADLFHVYPTDGYVNNMRSNYPHGDVGDVSKTSQNGSKLGTASFSGISGTVFEVIDEYKGDFARSYFYFATRYCDKISDFTNDGKKMFSTSMPYMNTNFINQYYEWHIKDPVSDKEINRNEAVYGIQKNRNPYIDHPEWVAYAFKGIKPEETDDDPVLQSISLSGTYQIEFTVDDTFSYAGLIVTANYSSGSPKTVTPTSVSTPDMSTTGEKTITVKYNDGTTEKSATYKITVNAASPDPVKHTTDLTLNKTTATVSVGETITLVATKTPSDSVDGVTWSTSDSSVATVSNGVVTGVKAGTVTITATSNNIPATCSIEVKSQSSSDTVTASIDFTNSNSFDTDDLGNMWSSSGESETGSYFKMKSDTTTIKSSAIEVDTSKTVNVSLNIGYFGGKGVSVDVYAVNSTGTVITNTLNFAPTTNDGSTSYEGVLTFNVSSSPVNFIIASKGTSTSNSGKYVRFYRGSFEYTEKSTGPISVNNISVVNAPTSIEQNKSIDVSIDVEPNNATDNSVTWNSSNNAIVEISNATNTGARLTAKGSVDAKATITITANDGSGVSTSFEVTIVEKKVLVGITYSGKTTYAVDSSMANNDGHLVYAQYSDGTEINVTSSATITGFDSSEEKLNKITISYTEDNVTKTTTQQLLILEDINSGDGESYYEKVTSTADLNDGKYLIVYESGKVAFNGALTTLDAVSNTVATGDIANGKIAATEALDKAAFTYTSSNSSFLGSGGKYFGHSGSSNGLSSSNTALTANISFANGNVVIRDGGNYSLRFNNDSKQMRFRYYSSGQQDIQIYKYVQGQSSLSAEQKAKIYSASFLEAFTCDGSGAKAPTFASDITWTSLSTEYSKLDAATKALFENATYTLSGSEVDATGETNIVIAYAVARYDFVVSKYNWEDFMGRGVSSSRRTPVISISNMDTSTVIISSIAAVGIVAIGGYFFYKKRKEQ